MKKLLTLILALALAAGMTACSGAPSQADISADGSGATASEEDRSAMLAAYRAVLEGLYFSHTLPGRDLADEASAGTDQEEARFALYDVDADGRDELILLFSNGYTASALAIIYDYDSAAGAVREEFSEAPYLTFYDSGFIRADYSHNQGLAPENFWPYTLYQYDPEADLYIQVAAADAWEKESFPKDYSGQPFPDDADADGDGMVYYVSAEGLDGSTPIDGAEYTAWWDALVGQGKAVDFAYLELSEESIAGLQ